MSFWHWKHFHLFLKSKSSQILINKGNIDNFWPCKIFVFLPHFWVSRYLLDTQRKVSKKVSKKYFYILRHQKSLILQGFSYLPQQFLYFFPDPHGKILKQPGNFFLLNWYFLFQIYNFLFNYCKFFSYNLSNNLSKKID